jgi:hypothetical protein
MNMHALLHKSTDNPLARTAIATTSTTIEIVTNHYFGLPGDATRIAVRHCIDSVHNTPNHTTSHGCD